MIMSDELRPGDLYEDAFCHPCICFGISDGLAWGISLIDGSYPRTADLYLGGARKLELDEAWSIKKSWRAD